MNLIRHAAMNFHKLFNSEPSKRRYYGLELFLHEDGVEAVLVADGLKNVELDQGESVSLAVFELLKKLGLRLVV